MAWLPRSDPLLMVSCGSKVQVGVTCFWSPWKSDPLSRSMRVHECWVGPTMRGIPPSSTTYNDLIPPSPTPGRRLSFNDISTHPVGTTVPITWSANLTKPVSPCRLGMLGDALTWSTSPNNPCGSRWAAWHRFLLALRSRTPSLWRYDAAWSGFG